MSEIRKVVWASDSGKPKPGEGIPKPGVLEPARAVLEKAQEYFSPFVRKLSQNTGDARIVLSVEYREENRGRAENTPETMTLPAAPVKRKYPDIQPFTVAGPESVRGAIDLPCPKCKARAGFGCDLTPPNKGKGKPAQQTGIHSERLDLLSRYREYSPE